MAILGRGRLMKALLALAGVTVAGLALLKAVLDATYFRGYDPSQPLNAVNVSTEDFTTYRRILLQFEGFPGVPVPAFASCRPPEETARRRLHSGSPGRIPRCLAPGPGSARPC